MFDNFDNSCCSLFSGQVVSDPATPWTAARQASPSFTVSQSLLKLMSIGSVMPFNRLILYCPLLFLSSMLPSIRVFSNESALHLSRPKYWSFSFSLSPSNEHSGLISYRIDFLTVQATLKRILKHHNVNDCSQTSRCSCPPKWLVRSSEECKKQPSATTATP